MMIAKLFCVDLSGKKFCQKILISKNVKQKLHHQVVQAEALEAEALEAEVLRVEVEAIQKLPLSYPWFLVINYKPLKELLWRFVFCHENNQF